MTLQKQHGYLEKQTDRLLSPDEHGQVLSRDELRKIGKRWHKGHCPECDEVLALCDSHNLLTDAITALPYHSVSAVHEGTRYPYQVELFDDVGSVVATIEGEYRDAVEEAANRFSRLAALAQQLGWSPRSRSGTMASLKEIRYTAGEVFTLWYVLLGRLIYRVIAGRERDDG